MAIDVRHIGGGFLTLSMFVMLANMLRDELSFNDSSPPSHFESVSKMSNSSIRSANDELWGTPAAPLTPCWQNEATAPSKSKGYVQFVLSNGPHYHSSQVSEAIFVAKYLGATLVVPQIIGGSSSEEKSEFESIYNIDSFIEKVGQTVEVARQLPKVLTKKTVVVKIPHRVTESFLAENVKPSFKKAGSIMLTIHYPSINMKIREIPSSEFEYARCLGLYDALQFNKHVRSVGDEMLLKLQKAKNGTPRKFVAVDLRLDILLKDSYEKYAGISSSVKRKCFSTQDIALFLRKAGFQRNTAIYLTQPIWHDNLSFLKDIFPNIYYKEMILPSAEKRLFHYGKSEFEKALDSYICLRSDVFVPAVSGMFYANIAGQRIAAGKTQILVPTTNLTSSNLVASSISRFVTEKCHIAYSCFC